MEVQKWLSLEAYLKGDVLSRLKRGSMTLTKGDKAFGGLKEEVWPPSNEIKHLEV